MPESTPIYGFTYPCPDEVVTSAHFATLANQIDAKLLELDADQNLALNRPNVDVAQAGFQTIPVGVETVLTSPDATYTASMSGVYVVRGSVADDPGASPTITGWRARVRRNGVTQFGFTHSTPGNTVHPLQPTGVIVATAGDVFTIAVLFTGAGTLNVGGAMQAKLITRIA